MPPTRIEADGLFNGDRINACSDEAKLHWPRLWLASNGYARLELNYSKVMAVAYSSFRERPSEKKFRGWIEEYAQHFLLFRYETAGGPWGAWCTEERHLPDYRTAEDRRSPAPPAKEFRDFQARYLKAKQKWQARDINAEAVEHVETQRRAARTYHYVPPDLHVELIHAWKEMLTKKVVPRIGIFAQWVEHYREEEIFRSIFIAGERYRQKPFGRNEIEECTALVHYVSAILRNRKQGIVCEVEDEAGQREAMR